METNQAVSSENPTTPAQIVEQLRVVRAAIGNITVMTPAERRKVSQRVGRVDEDVLQAQINSIGAADILATAVGQPMDEVQKLADETRSWTIVEAELRAMLAGVEGANLLRRRQLESVTSRASGLGAQLARDPNHAPVLLPHVLEIRRLKRLARRKKPAVPETPKSASDSTTPGM